MLHEFAVFDGFLVHLRHITQEHGLVPNLTQLLLQFELFVGDLAAVGVLSASLFHVLEVLLNLHDVPLVSDHVLLVFLVEEALEAEVHHADGALQMLDRYLNLLARRQVLRDLVEVQGVLLFQRSRQVSIDVVAVA